MLSPSKLSSHWFTVLVAICLATIAINLWRKNTRAVDVERSGPPRIQPVGDTVQQLTVNTIDGRSLSLFPVDFNFVLYFGVAHPKNLQKAIYTGFLAKRNQNPHVSFLIITGGRFREFEDLHSSGMLKDFVEDTTSQVAHSLAIDKSDNASLILDGHGKIVFRVPLSLDAEDVRQLYERYANGRIDYSHPAYVSSALIGKQFPQLPLREVTSNTSIPVSQVVSNMREYWVFTARCPVCSLSSFFKHLTKYSAERNIVPIFSSRLPIPALRQVAVDNNYQGPIYVAEGELSGLEDIYSSSSFSDYIAIIRMTNAGMITSAIPVNPFNLDEKLKQP